MPLDRVEIFCPATVANVSCGFDVLGLALAEVGDKMVIEKSHQKGVRIRKIVGQDLPLDPHKNVAGVAVLSLLDHLNSDAGFDIEIYKNIKPGSGIGSSAASSTGAVYGVNKLLGEPLTRKQLITHAMKGEELASGVGHADNVAPALLGGFTLVRSYAPLDVLKIHTPAFLFVTVIHPQIEVKTADARNILKRSIPLKKAIQQWGNLAGLITGLHTEDYDLIGRSLEDVIVEPMRSLLIPAFDEAKKNSIEAGALGAGISGSGPSIYAISKGKNTAEKVAVAMQKTYAKTGIAYDIHVAPIDSEGVRVLKD